MRFVTLILFPIVLLTQFTIRTLNAAPCNEVIVAEVMSRYQLDSASYQIDVLSNQFEGKDVEPSDVSFKPLSQKEPLGLFTVLMTVTDSTGETTATQVRMRVSKYADVLIASDRITKGESLNPSQLEVTRMDVTNLYEQPLTDPNQVVGLQAKRNLVKGTVITTGCVGAPPAVVSGRPLTILYEHAGCRITAPGVALQTAQTGEYTKVRNASSGAVLLARVIGENNVAIEP